MMNLRRAFLVWLVIICVESLHGVLRTLLLQPLVGDFRARQVAVFTGSALILTIAYLLGPWLRVRNTKFLLGVGLLWVLWTVAFELALGRLVLDMSWQRILSDYDLLHGGLMVFGLAFLALSPLIAARLREERGQRRAA
jgi:hypothetical protein